ncbi:PAAR domain-containing protein, partial [Pseudomonas agarici]
MGRGSVNGMGQGLDGDRTTTGAVCISSLPSATQGGGRGVLRLGDKTTPCPLCGKAGVIVESLPAMKWMGVATALDGARVHCGCPPGRNRLIAPVEQASHTSAAASRAPIVAPAPTPAPATAKPEMPIRELILEEEEEEEELEQSGIVLHLGLFFDGTGNNQGNSAIGEGCRASDLGMDRETAVMIRQLCTTYGFDASGVPPDNSYG